MVHHPHHPGYQQRFEVVAVRKYGLLVKGSNDECFFISERMVDKVACHDVRSVEQPQCSVEALQMLSELLNVRGSPQA